MKPSKSSPSINHSKHTSAGKVNGLNYIGMSVIKFLLSFFLFSSVFVAKAQFIESTFEKVFIEIDGEEVFDLYEIIQDHHGYIWLATNLGLIRYDGLEGKKYYKKNSDSSSNDFSGIESMYVDSQGDLWIGARSGLSRYDADCDCFYQFPSIKLV